MPILDLWGISFHAVVVFGLGKNLLFKSVLGHCVSSLKRIHVRSCLFFCIFLFMIPQFQPLISTKIDHGAKFILVGREVFLVCYIPVFLCFLIYFCRFFITPTNTSWYLFIY